MRDRRLAALMVKEWRDVASNPVIVAFAIIMPLLMVGICAGLAIWMDTLTVGQSGSLPPSVRHLPFKVATLVLINESTVLPTLLLIPMFIPLTMATYTIIGEKEQKSLEPLLATPVSTMEIILAKSLAYAAPVILLTWASYAALAAVLYFAYHPVAFAYLVRPAWTLGFSIVTPPLSLLSSLLGLMASARAKDPKSAQAIGMVLLPVMLVPMFSSMGVLLSTTVMGYTAGVLMLLDYVALRLAVPVFGRERILMRWK